MGSQSDWQILSHTAETLDILNIGYETEIISAHRTPDKLYGLMAPVDLGEKKYVKCFERIQPGENLPSSFKCSNPGRMV